MNQPQNILFIINPHSGIGKQKLMEEYIGKNLDRRLFTPTICYTERKGHAYDLAAEAQKNGIAIIAIAGGDGTVNEAGRALMGTNCSLLIIPTGSGNGIANHYKIPGNAEAILRSLGYWKIIKTDVGMINEFPFFGFCGFGFDAHIAHEFAKLKSRGMAGYTRLVFREFKKFIPQEIELRCNGEVVRENPFILSVANVSEYGNGVKIDPDADTCDGELAVCSIRKVNPFQLAVLFFKSRKGNISYSEFYRKRKGDSFEIISTQALKAHIDGEPWEFTDKRLKIRITDKQLQLLVP